MAKLINGNSCRVSCPTSTSDSPGCTALAGAVSVAWPSGWVAVVEAVEFDESGFGRSPPAELVAPVPSSLATAASVNSEPTTFCFALFCAASVF